jgi:hypothetical protein
MTRSKNTRAPNMRCKDTRSKDTRSKDTRSKDTRSKSRVPSLNANRRRVPRFVFRGIHIPFTIWSPWARFWRGLGALR